MAQHFLICDTEYHFRLMTSQNGETNINFYLDNQFLSDQFFPYDVQKVSTVNYYYTPKIYDYNEKVRDEKALVSLLSNEGEFNDILEPKQFFTRKEKEEKFAVYSYILALSGSILFIFKPPAFDIKYQGVMREDQETAFNREMILIEEIRDVDQFFSIENALLLFLNSGDVVLYEFGFDGEVTTQKIDFKDELSVSDKKITNFFCVSDDVSRRRSYVFILEDELSYYYYLHTQRILQKFYSKKYTFSSVTVSKNGKSVMIIDDPENREKNQLEITLFRSQGDEFYSESRRTKNKPLLVEDTNFGTKKFGLFNKNKSYRLESIVMSFTGNCICLNIYDEAKHFEGGDKLMFLYNSDIGHDIVEFGRSVFSIGYCEDEYIYRDLSSGEIICHSSTLHRAPSQHVKIDIANGGEVFVDLDYQYQCLSFYTSLTPDSFYLDNAKKIRGVKYFVYYTEGEKLIVIYSCIHGIRKIVCKRKESSLEEEERGSATSPPLASGRGSRHGMTLATPISPVSLMSSSKNSKKEITRMGSPKRKIRRAASDSTGVKKSMIPESEEAGDSSRREFGDEEDEDGESSSPDVVVNVPEGERVGYSDAPSTVSLPPPPRDFRERHRDRSKAEIIKNIGFEKFECDVDPIANDTIIRASLINRIEQIVKLLDEAMKNNSKYNQYLSKMRNSLIEFQRHITVNSLNPEILNRLRSQIYYLQESFSRSEDSKEKELFGGLMNSILITLAHLMNVGTDNAAYCYSFFNYILEVDFVIEEIKNLLGGASDKNYDFGKRDISKFAPLPLDRAVIISSHPREETLSIELESSPLYEELKIYPTIFLNAGDNNILLQNYIFPKIVSFPNHQRKNRGLRLEEMRKYEIDGIVPTFVSFESGKNYYTLVGDDQSVDVGYCFFADTQNNKITFPYTNRVTTQNTFVSSVSSTETEYGSEIFFLSLGNKIHIEIDNLKKYDIVSPQPNFPNSTYDYHSPPPREILKYFDESKKELNEVNSVDALIKCLAKLLPKSLFLQFRARILEYQQITPKKLKGLIGLATNAQKIYNFLKVIHLIKNYQIIDLAAILKWYCESWDEVKNVGLSGRFYKFVNLIYEKLVEIYNRSEVSDDDDLTKFKMYYSLRNTTTTSIENLLQRINDQFSYENYFEYNSTEMPIITRELEEIIRDERENVTLFKDIFFFTGNKIAVMMTNEETTSFDKLYEDEDLEYVYYLSKRTEAFKPRSESEEEAPALVVAPSSSEVVKLYYLGISTVKTIVIKDYICSKGISDDEYITLEDETLRENNIRKQDYIRQMMNVNKRIKRLNIDTQPRNPADSISAIKNKIFLLEKTLKNTTTSIISLRGKSLSLSKKLNDLTRKLEGNNSKMTTEFNKLEELKGELERETSSSVEDEKKRRKKVESMIKNIDKQKLIVSGIEFTVIKLYREIQEITLKLRSSGLEISALNTKIKLLTLLLTKEKERLMNFFTGREYGLIEEYTKEKNEEYKERQKEIIKDLFDGVDENPFLTEIALEFSEEAGDDDSSITAILEEKSKLEWWYSIIQGMIDIYDSVYKEIKKGLKKFDKYTLIEEGKEDTAVARVKNAIELKLGRLEESLTLLKSKKVEDEMGLIKFLNLDECEPVVKEIHEQKYIERFEMLLKLSEKLFILIKNKVVVDTRKVDDILEMILSHRPEHDIEKEIDELFVSSLKDVDKRSILTSIGKGFKNIYVFLRWAGRGIAGLFRRKPKTSPSPSEVTLIREEESPSPLVTRAPIREEESPSPLVTRAPIREEESPRSLPPSLPPVPDPVASPLFKEPILTSLPPRPKPSISPPPGAKPLPPELFDELTRELGPRRVPSR